MCLRMVLIDPVSVAAVDIAAVVLEAERHGRCKWQQKKMKGQDVGELLSFTKITVAI